MSTATIIVLVVLAYIMQVLLMLAYPYYKYRQNYKSHQQRTIGHFTNFTNHIMGDGYMLLVFFPLIGLLALVVSILIGLIIEGLKLVYNKFIKDIKI